MTGPMPRDDTDYKFTAEQIARLERGLLSLRESDRSSPEVRDAIATVDYQEILRLRAELDAAMGFVEPYCDLVVSLSGPKIGIGVAPASTIADFLSNLRLAVQSIATYLITNKLPGSGRRPSVIAQLADFQFVGVDNGSIKLKFQLPQQSADASGKWFEQVRHSLMLILEAISWAYSDCEVEALEARVGNLQLARVVLSQAHRLAPGPLGAANHIEFYSRFDTSGSKCVLDKRATDRLCDAMEKLSERSVHVFERGAIRAVDVDKGTFSLRDRPSEQVTLPCVVLENIFPQVVEYLVEGQYVEVFGILEHDNMGKPYKLKVERVTPISETQMGYSILTRRSSIR